MKICKEPKSFFIKLSYIFGIIFLAILAVDISYPADLNPFFNPIRYTLALGSPLFFCDPSQLLVFIPILGGLMGVYVYFSGSKKSSFEKMKTYLLPIFAFLVYLFYYYLFKASYVYPSLFWGFTFVYWLVMIFAFLVRKYELIQKIAFIFLIVAFAYLLTGITGNACLYLPTHFERDSSSNLRPTNYLTALNMSVGEQLTMNESMPGINEISIDCNLNSYVIRLDSTGRYAAIVGFYANLTNSSQPNSTQTPYHRTIVYEGGKLTTCNFQSTLKKYIMTLILLNGRLSLTAIFSIMLKVYSQ